LTAATTAQVDVCVEVTPLEQSRERGVAAQWAVAAWTTGGNVPDVKIQLQASPASAGTPLFTFGCGSDDGKSLCDLGAVDATSAQRELQAQVTVPITAATVTSVTLKATGIAANLHTDPAATAAMTILAPPSPVAASMTLPVGTVPGVTFPAVNSISNSTLSPGGNASGLFPTVAPQSPDPRSGGTAGTRPVANTSALPAGSSTLGAQVAGLVALALAAVFAVTRISIRRPAPAGAADTAAAAPPPEAPAEPADSAGSPDSADSAGESEAPADPPSDPA
jgi:hypothetical protein